MSQGSIVALNTFLGPLKGYFDQEGIAEISINKPGEIWVEQAFEMTLKKEQLAVTHPMLLRARQILL